MILVWFLVLIFLFGFLLFFVDLFRTYALIERVFYRFLLTEKNQNNVSEDFFSSLLNELSKLFHSHSALYYKYEENTLYLNYYHFKKKSNIRFFNLNPIKITKKEEKNLTRFIEKSLKEKMVFFDSEKNFLDKNYLIFPILRKGKKLDSFYVFFFSNPIAFIRAKKIFFLSNRKVQRILLYIHSVIRSRKESMISHIMESIRDYAFLILDSNLYIGNWNFGAQTIFGYKSYEIVGKSFKDLIFKENENLLKNLFKQANREDSARIKLNMLDSEGRKLVCEVLVQSLESDLILSGYAVLIKDETKTEILKESIEKSSLINRAIVENNRDGILLLDSEDRIIFMNERVKNIMEFKTKPIGTKFSFSFPENYGKKIEEKIKELRDERFEFQFLDFQIKNFWYNIRFFKLKKNINKKTNTDKKYNGVILFFIDNTQRVQINKRLKHQKEELEIKKKELEFKNQNLLRDLDSARMIQLSLIPKNNLDTSFIRTDVFFYLSDKLGGDFYYFEELKIKEKIYYPVLVVDVSGHGVSASMLTVLVKDTYNEFKDHSEEVGKMDPKEFVRILNLKVNHLQIENSNFITVFFVVFDVMEKKLKYSSAGHPSMVRIREKKEIAFLDIPNSPPTGLFEEFVYKQKEEDLKEGDLFLIYSDGILDLFPNEKSYLNGFKDFISSNKEKSVSDLKKEIKKRAEQSQKDRDDITLLFVEFKNKRKLKKKTFAQ